MVRSPVPDDLEFTDRLARRDVFVPPGALVELPGHVRVSRTASDDVIDDSSPGLGAALREPAQAG